MSPKYIEGDNLTIKKQSTCNNGQDAIIIVNRQDATLKKVIISETGIVLQPLNSDYEPLFFNCSDVEKLPITILGVVVELRRKIK